MTDEQLADLRRFVKPLGWLAITDDDDCDFETYGMGHRYSVVTRTPTSHFLFLNGWKKGEYDALEAAKAAAQADHADRILSAVPALAAQVVKLTEALERIDALEGQSMPLDPFLEAKAIARATLEARK